MYSGVPLMDVSTIVLLLMARAKPKSHSFTTPFAPIKMFCVHRHILSSFVIVSTAHACSSHWNVLFALWDQVATISNQKSPGASCRGE